MSVKKLTLVFISLAAIFAFFTVDVAAQGTKTIILVRHAEKDLSASADPNDPGLSPEGRLRAERLWKIVKRFRPGAIYSTDYRRTRETLATVAKKRNLEIRVYDPRKPEALITEINSSSVNRSLVVGHSNTIPGLANLFVKKEVFKQLDDAEHSVVYVIRMRNGVFRRIDLFTY